MLNFLINYLVSWEFSEIKPKYFTKLVKFYVKYPNQSHDNLLENILSIFARIIYFLINYLIKILFRIIFLLKLIILLTETKK